MHSCSHGSHIVNIVRFSLFQYLPNDMYACPFIHVWKYCQQRSLLAEFEQRINCQRATIAVLLQFVIPSPPICWQSWPRNILRRGPKEEQNQYCCHSYLRYMVKKRNPFEPQVMGKSPHGDSKCTIRPRKNNSAGWI
jgi:hypothetical protein